MIKCKLFETSFSFMFRTESNQNYELQWNKRLQQCYTVAPSLLLYVTILPRRTYSSNTSNNGSQILETGTSASTIQIKQTIRSPIHLIFPQNTTSIRLSTPLRKQKTFRNTRPCLFFPPLAVYLPPFSDSRFICR